MSDSPVVTFDVDEVLLKYDQCFLKSLGVELPVDHPHTSYEALLGMNDDEIQRIITEFNESPAFACIDPLDGAVDAVRRIKEAGFDINIITACGTSTATHFHRRVNLIDVFGDVFNSITLIPMRVSKLPYLENETHSTLWVDDSESHYHSGRQLGIPSMLMRSGFNKNRDSGIDEVAETWQCVLKRLNLVG